MPLSPSIPPYTYSLSQNEPLCVSRCDIYPSDQGFHVVLGEHTIGALIQFFVVRYDSLEAKLSYQSSRAAGFRIPSCYGTLQSLKYFQRNGIDCILTHMKCSSGDLIDLYEYKPERGEWISMSLVNSPQAGVTSISFPGNQLLIVENEYQGLFGRQLLLALSDGSIVCFDRLTLKCREQNFVMKQTDFFIRVQHTSSGKRRDEQVDEIVDMRFFHSQAAVVLVLRRMVSLFFCVP